MTLPAVAKNRYRQTIDAATARSIAEEFLARKVGDLLAAGAPYFGADGFWVVPVLIGNPAQGMLGEVGIVQIRASDGEVLFSEEERAKVEARAEELVGASPRGAPVSLEQLLEGVTEESLHAEWSTGPAAGSESG